MMKALSHDMKPGVNRSFPVPITIDPGGDDDRR
jgi:hypothetical protein